jgi:hypothetical protein
MSPVVTSIAGNRSTVTDPRVLSPSLSVGQECVMESLQGEYYFFDVFDAAHGAHAEALSVYRKALAAGEVDPSSPIAVAAAAAEDFITEKCKLKRSSLWGFLKGGAWRVFIGEVVEEEEPPVPVVHVGKKLADVPVIVVVAGAPCMRSVRAAAVVRESSSTLGILDEETGEEHEVPIDVASRFFVVPVEIINIASADKPLADALKRLPVSSDNKLFAANEMCLHEFRAVVAAASIPASIAAQVASVEPSSPVFKLISDLAIAELSARLSSSPTTTLPLIPSALGRALSAKTSAPIDVSGEAEKPVPSKPSSEPTADKHPLATAMCALAVNKTVCDKFLHESVNISEPDNARHAYVRGSDYRVRGAIERVLKSRGITAADISGSKCSDADEILEKLEDFVQMPKINSGASANNNSGVEQLGDGAGGGASLVDAIAGLSKSSSLGANDDPHAASALRTAARGVASDSEALARLRAMQGLAASRDFVNLEILKNQEKNPHVLLLLSSEIEKVNAALSGVLGDSALTMVLDVRNGLLNRLVWELFPDEPKRPAAQLAAISHARVGRLSRVILPALLDLSDSKCSITKPLVGFASMSDPGEKLQAALSMLQQIIALVSPSQTSESMRFFRSLGEFLREQRERGCTWEMLSVYYGKIIAQVETPAEAFSRGSGGGLVLVNLNLQLLATNTKACYRLEQALADHGRKPAVTTPRGTLPQPVSVKIPKEKWDQICVKVDTAIGEKGGKKPCYVFFILGSCARGDKCGRHHDPAAKAGSFAPKPGQ